MATTTTTAATEYFDSADLYFEPDDPAVWNPEHYSPHHRFRSFVSRGSKLLHPNRNPTGRPGNNHHHHNHNYSSSAATRYFLTTAGGKTVATASTPPLHPESVTTFFSESLASLARTSTSSSEDDPAQEGKDDDSCCGSLAYSVDSERHFVGHHHEEHEDDHYLKNNTALHHHPVPSLLNEQDVYADDNDANVRNSVLWTIPSTASEQDTSKSKYDGCFQPRSDSQRMECFQPLAWIGDLFQLLLRSAEEKRLKETYGDVVMER